MAIPFMLKMWTKTLVHWHFSGVSSTLVIHLDVLTVQCLEAWEEVIPKIQRTDVISDDASRTSPKSSASVLTSS